MIVSSMRLRNSGKKLVCRAPRTASRISSSLPPSWAICWINWLPMFEVITIDRVGEVDRATVAVGQPAVVEHLQQHVEHVAMGFLDFVQQDDAIGAAADGFGQAAPLFVAHVARRSADQPAHGVPLHEFAHVDANHGVFVVEQHLGQRLAQLGFADAGGPQEDERADRPIRVLQARTVAADGVRRPPRPPRPDRQRAGAAVLPAPAAWPARFPSCGSPECRSRH